MASMRDKVWAGVFSALLGGMIMLAPAADAGEGGMFDGVLQGFGNYIGRHRANMDNHEFEEDVPVKFKRDLDMDRVYAPYDMPYSMAAIALHYDSLAQYDRSAYFYRKAFRDAIGKKEQAALSMVVVSRVISDQTAGEITEAFKVLADTEPLWNDAFAKWTSDVARAYLNLSIGDYEAASESLLKARAHALDAADKKREKDFGVMYLLFQMDKIEGSLKYLNGDLQGALGPLNKAKEMAVALKKSKIGKKMPGSFFVKMGLDVSIYLAMIDAAQGKQGAGMAGLKAAYDEAVKIKWPWGEAQSALFLALTAEKAKDASAAELFQRSLEVAQKTKIPFFVWQSYFHLGGIALAKGQNTEAVKYLNDAIAVIESLRSKIDYDTQKTSFMGDKRQVYEALVFAFLAQNDVKAAFEVAEKAKSRALVDLLSSKQVGAGQTNVSPELIAQEQTLFEEISRLRNQGGGKAAAESAVLEEQYKRVLAQIKAANPELVSLKSVDLATVAQVQALLDADNAILEYFQTEKALLAWLVTKDGIRVEKIDIGRKELADKVRSVRIMMGKPKVPAVYKLLEKLGPMLLVEAFDKDTQGKSLCIVPDGPLHYLPFAALKDKNGKFLPERGAIYYAPSANVLKYCIEKRKEGFDTILAFGNPDLSDRKMDLPNAELEAKAIKEKFPKTDLYVRGEALESVSKKLMGNYDIVHFACHGEMDPVKPLLSCLRLAPDGINDGRLEAGEIFDMALKAKLVVLSGCETGLGKIASGDEIIGLTRGFLYAGAPSVMASLWKVDDSATSILMTTFYGDLSKMGKAEALRQAQLKTMETKKHPYYWASFFLVGDGK